MLFFVVIIWMLIKLDAPVWIYIITALSAIVRTFKAIYNLE